MSIAAPARTAEQTDRNFALAIHLSPLAAFILGPLLLAPFVLWLMRRDESAFVDDHGREMANALISFLLYHVIAIVTLIGVLALPVLYIVGIVNLVYLFNPDAIVIAGGLAKAGELFLESVRRALRAESFRTPFDSVRLRVAKISDLGSIGAALYSLECPGERSVS